MQAPQADPQQILDRMADGFIALDDSWRITYANAEGQEILHASAPEDVDRIDGRNLWETISESRETVFYDEFTRAMETQESVAFEARYTPVGAWFEIRAFPSESGLSIYFRDISDYKQLSQERQESLYALQQLYSISSDRTTELPTKAGKLLELGCDYLDLPNG